MVKNLYQYRFEKPHFGVREGLILQMGDGWGEIAPLPGFSQETLPQAKKQTLEVLQKKAIPTFPSVKFGFFCASKPFDTSPLKVPLCALHLPKEKCTHLKLKLKNLKLQEAISLVKEYVGKYHLRIDCNRAWSLSESLEFASHFSSSDFEYLEEPVQSYEDLVKFSEITKFPIAVDESLREKSYLDIPTLKAAIVKPTLQGEIPKLSCPIVLSSSYESSLGILQIARLANHSSFPLGLDTFSEDVLTPPLQVSEGHLVWEGNRHFLQDSALCLIASVP